MPRKRRRGRKARRPNGHDLNPYVPKEDMARIATEARGRVFQVPEGLIAKMPETSILGKLRAFESISDRQYQSALAFQANRDALSAMHPPSQMPAKAGDLDRGSGHDSLDGTDPAYVAKFQRTKELDRQAREAMKNTHFIASTLVDMAISTDVTTMEFPDDWLPTLCEALDELGKVFGVGQST